MEDKKDLKEQKNPNTKIYFYLAVSACVLCAIAFGLSFSPLGVYSLISSILLGIACLSFCGAQKKKNNFKAVFYVKIIACVLLAFGVLLFIGGMIYSITVPQTN